MTAKIIKIPEPSYWGNCPKCRAVPRFLNVGRQHWCVCHKHKVKWCIGENLFSGWREESEQTWQLNELRLSAYQIVTPWHGGTATNESQERAENETVYDKDGLLVYASGYVDDLEAEDLPF